MKPDDEVGRSHDKAVGVPAGQQAEPTVSAAEIYAVQRVVAGVPPDVATDIVLAVKRAAPHPVAEARAPAAGEICPTCGCAAMRAEAPAPEVEPMPHHVDGARCATWYGCPKCNAPAGDALGQDEGSAHFADAEARAPATASGELDAVLPKLEALERWLDTLTSNPKDQVQYRTVARSAVVMARWLYARASLVGGGPDLVGGGLPSVKEGHSVSDSAGDAKDALCHLKGCERRPDGYCPRCHDGWPDDGRMEP